MLRWDTEIDLLLKHWQYFLIVLPGVIFVHNAAHNAVFWKWNSAHMYERRPLPDMFMGTNLDVPSATEATRVGTMVMTIVTFLMAFGLRTGHSSVLILRRFIAVYATASLLRCVVFFVTLIPAPSSYCLSRAQGGTYSALRAPHTLNDVLTRFDVTHACGDLLFSGHTVLITCMYLTIELCFGGAWDRFHASRDFINDGKWAVMQILALYGARLKLALFTLYTVRARKHYSIDVLVAVLFTLLLWAVYSPLFPTQVDYDSDDIPCTCCTKCAKDFRKEKQQHNSDIEKAD